MQKNPQKIALFAAFLAVFMFSFSFALSPLYRVVCKVTGLNGGVNVAEITTAERVNSPLNQHAVLVQFLATNNANLPWTFYPEKNSLEVYPNHIGKMIFIARNNSNHTMTIQAVPSFAPPVTAKYFHKLECFCFRQQTLAPGETKEMPVVFRVDESLPEEIHTITLAYTLFAVKRTAA